VRYGSGAVGPPQTSRYAIAQWKNSARERRDPPTVAANAVRVQLHALAYNFGNFPALATPEPVNTVLSSLKKKLIKIGAKIIGHGRIAAFFRGDCSPPPPH